MTGLLRYILAGCLTLAMIASGVPSVRMAAAGPVHQAIHVHAHADAHAFAAQMHVAPDTHVHSESGAPAEKSVDFCEDMNCCTMCAMAYVAPVSRSLMPVRIALAVHYDVADVSLTEAPIFLNPGIPIAA